MRSEHPLFDEISARFLAADIDTHHAAGEVEALLRGEGA